MRTTLHNCNGSSPSAIVPAGKVIKPKSGTSTAIPPSIQIDAFLSNTRLRSSSSQTTRENNAPNNTDGVEFVCDNYNALVFEVRTQ